MSFKPFSEVLNKKYIKEKQSTLEFYDKNKDDIIRCFNQYIDEELLIDGRICADITWLEKVDCVFRIHPVCLEEYIKKDLQDAGYEKIEVRYDEDDMYSYITFYSEEE